MKSLKLPELDKLPGIRLKPGDTFRFRCHPEIACFNKCCRNLNLFLHPFDVVRLKQSLGISSDRFLEEYTDVILRKGNFFPDVLLRMADNDECTCPFLSEAGCRVYPDRPGTCRTFPLEQGLICDARRRQNEPVYFFRPPDFCLGRHEDTRWSVEAWTADQEASEHNRMTEGWAKIKQLFQEDPWGRQGLEGAGAKMAFMSVYNVDRFREFVLQSSFLSRYKVKSALIKKLRNDDTELLKFAFDWVKLFVWNIPSKKILPRR